MTLAWIRYAKHTKVTRIGYFLLGGFRIAITAWDFYPHHNPCKDFFVKEKLALFCLCYVVGVTTYGNLYNWYTATAGSGTQTGVTGGADATMSICPSAGNGKSWKLPPNTGDGSYTNLFLTKAGLVTTTNGTNPTFVNTIQAEPYGFVLAGGYNNVPGGQGRYGYLWVRSSHGSDSNGSRLFVLWSATDTDRPGVFDLQNAYNKYVGFAVRCVLLRKNVIFAKLYSMNFCHLC